MGMTPLEGLVMGTRSGDVDPAILGFIAAKEGLSLHEVETMLNKQSGLLGISGLTHDMRVLQEECGSRRPPRQIGHRYFLLSREKIYRRVSRGHGRSGCGRVHGRDRRKFSEVRANICEGLGWAGLTLDDEKNKKAIGMEGVISRDGSRSPPTSFPPMRNY